MNQPETTAVAEARVALEYALAYSRRVRDPIAALDAFEAAVRAEERACCEHPKEAHVVEDYEGLPRCLECTAIVGGEHPYRVQPSTLEMLAQVQGIDPKSTPDYVALATALFPTEKEAAAFRAALDERFGAPSEPSEQEIELAAEAMRSLVASKMAGIPGSTMVLDLDDLRRWPTFYADVARAALQAVWR